MREIKFRAWDIENNKFLIQEEENTNIKELFDLFNLLNHCEIKYKERFILEQFTGLKDKNGKDIFEGDILNLKTSNPDNWAIKEFRKSTIVVVSFEKGSFVDENTSMQLWDKIRNISYSHESWTHYEIIGNIHQNKDLLK